MPLENISPDAILATARTSLECFGLALQPGFESPAHIKLMVEKIEELLVGRRFQKLAIITPPRHGKSLLSSVLLPAYFLGRNPAKNVICASYGAELSEGWGRRVRNIVGSPLFSSIFPACSLSADSAAMNHFSTVAGGEAVFTGRGGPLTGRGADLLVLDDLLKDQEEARSEIVCKAIIDWLQSTAFTRLAPKAKVLAISTRWSERDPMGWLLQQNGWHVLHLPAVSERGDDPLRRPIGAALWESRFPLHVLQEIRTAVGPAVWQTLYQGNPVAALGSVFKREWFHHYTQVPSSFKKIVQSWDTAFKAGTSNDFSVCTTWGTTPTGIYLLSMWRGRVEFPELKRQFAIQAEQWRPNEILIEDKASGQSLFQELKTATRFPVIAVKADSDKVTRASAVTGSFEAGKILFPDGAVWLPDLEDELAGFPGALHDDIVDSVTQAVNRLRDGRGVLGLVAWVRDRGASFLAGITSAVTAERKAWETITSKPATPAQSQYKQARPPLTFEPPTPPPCPECKATIVARCSGMLRCNACGAQWWAPGTEPKTPWISRGDVLSGRHAARQFRYPGQR
jgi:predicted phage terminase large subunit-like protein